MRTRVKICGVTNVEDAIFAARAGADSIGIIQVPTAKRRVDTGTAADIAAVLPPFVTPVLVFADAPPSDIRVICERTGIRTVQLHGHEPVETALALHGISVVKRLEVGITLAAELDHWSLLDRSALSGILLEGPGRSQRSSVETAPAVITGGTGTLTDFNQVELTLERVDRTALPPLLLAGGLTPENVTAVVRRFRPWGVDTSSGVENPAVPLKKDPRRTQAFIEAVHSADHWDDDANELS